MFLIPDDYTEMVSKPWILSKQPCLCRYPKTARSCKESPMKISRVLGQRLSHCQLSWILPSNHVSTFQDASGMWDTNAEGRICSQACPFCVCSNFVSAVRGQENASLAPCLLNTDCCKLILLSPELYLIFICVGASNKRLAGPAGEDLIPTEITF